MLKNIFKSVSYTFVYFIKHCYIGFLKMRKYKKKKAKVRLQKDSNIEVLPKTIDSLTPLLQKNSEDSSKSRDLVVYDPLKAYLREMRQYPPLTPEEEHELAVRYRENEDIDAAYSLVSSNLWLVVKIAKDYEKAARTMLDLIQEGNIGLMEAVKNFDPYRGVRFPSYAAWWVKAYIIRYLIANWRMVKIGTTQAQRKLFFNLQKEKEKLEQAGFEVEPKLLAEKLNVKEKEVIEMQQRLEAPDLSVDAPLGDEQDGGSLHSILPSSISTGEDAVVKKEYFRVLQQSFDKFSKTLNKKQKVIFDKRLRAEEVATLQELSDELNISKERVRQIGNTVQDKLKVFLEEEYQELVK